MGNTIHAGSYVLLDSASHPRVGEIWAFCADDGGVVVHRSLGRGRHGYRFQGDGRLDPDPPVPPHRIIGRVREVRHSGGQWRVGPRDRFPNAARLLALSAARGAYRRIPRFVRRRTAALRDLVAGRLR